MARKGGSSFSFIVPEPYEPRPAASTLDKPYLRDVYSRDPITGEAEDCGWEPTRSASTAWRGPHATFVDRSEKDAEDDD